MLQNNLLGESLGYTKQDWPYIGNLEAGWSVYGGTLIFPQVLYMFEISCNKKKEKKKEVHIVSKDNKK